MAHIVRDISNSTGVPVDQVRHILDEFIEKTGVAPELDATVLKTVQFGADPDQPVLPFFEEVAAA